MEGKEVKRGEEGGGGSAFELIRAESAWEHDPRGEEDVEKRGREWDGRRRWLECVEKRLGRADESRKRRRRRREEGGTFASVAISPPGRSRRCSKYLQNVRDESCSTSPVR